MSQRSLLIGIAGPSSSGKTVLANAVAQRLGETLVVSCDSYYFDLAHMTEEQIARYNLDHPDAIEHERLALDLARLREGEDVAAPLYDYATHRRSRETQTLSACPFIIVDGLHVLHWPDIRALLDVKVFVQADHETCLARRITRDITERGRTEEEVRSRYAETVRPMCDQHILPCRQFADIVVRGDGVIEDAALTVLDRIRALTG